MDTGMGGTSGGIMVGTRSGLLSPSLAPLLPVELPPGPTAMCGGRFVRLSGRDLLVLAAYLPPGPHAAPVREATLAELSRLVRSVRTPWVIAADWNLPAADLAAGGFLAFTRGIVVVPDGPTCLQGRGTTIDYLVCSPDLHGGIHLSRDLAVPWAPHVGLRYRVTGAPLAAIERQLRTAPALPTRAGAAPQPWAPCVPEDIGSPEALTEAYRQFSVQAEDFYAQRGGGRRPPPTRAGARRGGPRTWVLRPRTAPHQAEVRYFYRDANALGGVRCELLALSAQLGRRRATAAEASQAAAAAQRALGVWAGLATPPHARAAG